MSVEQESFCRACLRNYKTYHLLSDICTKTKTYLMLLGESTGVYAQPGDYLCISCARKLFKCYKFVRKVRDSDAILQEMNYRNSQDSVQQSDDDKNEATIIKSSELDGKVSMKIEMVVLSEDQLVNENEYDFEDGNTREENLLSPNNDEHKSPIAELNNSVGIAEVNAFSGVLLTDNDDKRHIYPKTEVHTFSGDLLTDNDDKRHIDPDIHNAAEDKPSSPDFCDDNISLKSEYISDKEDSTMTKETENQEAKDNVKEKLRTEKCNVCGKLLLTKITLRKHMKMHTGQKVKPQTATCSVCGRILSDKRNLPRHMLVHSKESSKNQNIFNQECSICGRVLRTKKTLKQHMLIHNGGKTFLCAMCPTTFYNKYKLQEHMRRHTGERPYECKFCKKTFTDVSAMGCHLRRHTGDRPYICDICGKSFAQPANMKSHRLQKHGEKTIPCPHCEQKFVRQIDLTYHLRRISEEKSFSCKFCSKSFYHKVRLIGHLKKFHPDQTDKADND